MKEERYGYQSQHLSDKSDDGSDDRKRECPAFHKIDRKQGKRMMQLSPDEEVSEREHN